jgi:hypothetical protein
MPLSKIKTASIENSTILGDDIANDAITAAKIAAASVDSSKLASGAAVTNIGYSPASGSYVDARTQQNTEVVATYAAATQIGSHYNTGNNNPTDGPLGNNQYMQIWVWNAVEGNLQITKLYENNSGQWYIRRNYRGTWSTWRTTGI